MKVKNNYGYELNLVGAVEKIDNGIIEKLKQYDDTIYFNDLDSNYWMFDFKINDLWFSGKNIDLVKNKITLEVFN